MSPDPSTHPACGDSPTDLGARLAAALRAGRVEAYDELLSERAEGAEGALGEEAARRIYAARLGARPITERDHRVARRLLAAGHTPSADQWARVCDREGWERQPTLTSFYRALASLTRAEAVEDWMLEAVYEAVREGPAWLEAHDRTARLEALCVALEHDAAGEALVRRFGRDVGRQDEDDVPSVVAHVLRRSGHRRWFVEPAFVEAVMATDGIEVLPHVVAHAPPPWPRRAFRRLAREDTELAASQFWQVDRSGPGDSRVVRRLTHPPAGIDRGDLAPLLTHPSTWVREVALWAIGRLEGRGLDGEAAGAGPVRAGAGGRGRPGR